VVRYDLPRLGRLDCRDVVHLQCHIGSECCDVVYTGVGAICWLTDIRCWARVIAGLLRPGGRSFMRDAHPILWAMSDPRPDGLLVIECPYFDTGGTTFVEDETYAGSGVVAAPESVIFNHGLGEIFAALSDAGLAVTSLVEHRQVSWNPLGAAMIPSPDFEEEFILADGRYRMPLSYTVQAGRAEALKPR
jgi:SAM-dependent methyltransferase